MKLQKLWLFYLVLMLPIVLLGLFAFLNKLGSWPFTILLLTYALFYNPLLQGWKLYKKGIIKKGEVFKMMIPFYPTKYFSEVFFR